MEKGSIIILVVKASEPESYLQHGRVHVPVVHGCSSRQQQTYNPFLQVTKPIVSLRSRQCCPISNTTLAVSNTFVVNHRLYKYSCLAASPSEECQGYD